MLEKIKNFLKEMYVRYVLYVGILLWVLGFILDVLRVDNSIAEPFLIVGFFVVSIIFILLLILYIYAKLKKIDLQNYIKYFNSDFKKVFIWSKWGLLGSFVFFFISLIVTGGNIIFFMLASSGSVDFGFDLMVFNMLFVFPALLVLLVISKGIIFLTREKQG